MKLVLVLLSQNTVCIQEVVDGLWLWLKTYDIANLSHNQYELQHYYNSVASHDLGVHHVIVDHVTVDHVM